MLTTDWIRTFRIHWVFLIFTLFRDTAGEEDGTAVCPVPDRRVVEAEYLRFPVCGGSDIREEGVGAGEEPSVTVPMETTASDGDGSGEKTDQELDTDSLLDNANFLSFEDWKKQNLAKVGQSAENVGGSRRADASGKDRPTGISNALDSLGEDAEIELDFGGFGADAPDAAKPTSWGPKMYEGMGENEEDVEEPVQSVQRTGPSRRKDAGTTCKERFNYASFDCAATVLKTNSEGKGSSSVLIENKDSYMLNECRAKNKFLILELCDDILVDTVVLANYEFFSSIFHTFRVSVSDRYPAKMDQWKELGVYEARNTREVQAFAVENSLIWARYLKVEFLTHYGTEFFCPLSLIRVHGTTMMEEYKHDGEIGRVEDDDAELEVDVAIDPAIREVDTPVESTTQSVDEMQDMEAATCLFQSSAIEAFLLRGPFGEIDTCSISIEAAKAAGFEEFTGTATDPVPNNMTASVSDSVSIALGSEVMSKETVEDVQKYTTNQGISNSTTSSMSTSEIVQQNSQQNGQQATTETDTKPPSFAREEQGVPLESVRSTTTQAPPPPPNPTTQESFFKSVNKRLQMLESNSTLSLLYIEEQSRILRDAFSKVEKRQLTKTSNFLENLNVTVLNELRQFREQYDQVWRTVAFEFEHQRFRYHQEIHSMSAQLGFLADELVFQKRVAVIQSIMVLFCFGLVLFTRSPVSSYLEFPSVQNMVSRSYSLRSSSPAFGSPSLSPSSTRPASSYRGANGHRRNLSEDSRDDRPPSPTVEYSPPTPVSDHSSQPMTDHQGHDSEALQIPMEHAHVRSRSSPPILNGSDADVEGDGSSQYSGSSNLSNIQSSIAT